MHSKGIISRTSVRIGSIILAYVLCPAIALAGEGLDSLDIDGTSQVHEMEAFTSLVATAAHFGEDWIAPLGALLIAIVATWRLWSARDFLGFGLGTVAAICLASLPYLMDALSAFGPT